MPGEKIPLHKPLGILFNPKWREVRNDKGYINKHAEQLRFLFSPSQEVWNRINRLFGHQIQEQVTIGVHIRRGDYSSYMNGIWFYDLVIYKKYMLQLISLFQMNKKSVRFFICSNEEIDTSIFNGCHFILQGDNDMMFDLYALAKCDYIIGPPSTYSQWASFYGKTPLAVLVNDDTKLSEQNFSIIKTLNNHFYKR